MAIRQLKGDFFKRWNPDGIPKKLDGFPQSAFSALWNEFTDVFGQTQVDILHESYERTRII